MRSYSQSTEMIFLIECKLVIAAFCLNQLREVKHQTEKYCQFETRIYHLLQAVINSLLITAPFLISSWMFHYFGLHMI